MDKAREADLWVDCLVIDLDIKARLELVECLGVLLHQQRLAGAQMRDGESPSPVRFELVVGNPRIDLDRLSEMLGRNVDLAESQQSIADQDVAVTKEPLPLAVLGVALCRLRGDLAVGFMLRERLFVTAELMQRVAVSL